MKNIQIVIAEALHSYELEINDKSISKEINHTLLEILVNDEPFEKINHYFYSKRDTEKILQSSVKYVITVLERAKYRVEISQKNNLSPTHICLYIIKKIEAFIKYLQAKF